MTTVLRSRLQFTVLHAFERREELPEVSDLRQGFLSLKIVQLALSLKARDRFLHPLVMCRLDF